MTRKGGNNIEMLKYFFELLKLKGSWHRLVMIRGSKAFLRARWRTASKVAIVFRIRGNVRKRKLLLGTSAK